MSKRTDALIMGLGRRLRAVDKIILEMQDNVGIMNKEPDPEAYLRWYTSYHAIQNLEGYVTESLEKLKEYNSYKNLPWWKRLFKRRF